MVGEESCNVYNKNDQRWEAGKSFYGGGTRRAPGDSTSGKFLKAIDIQTGKTVWEIPEIGGGILGSGLLATARGLIFYGGARGAVLPPGANQRETVLAFHNRPSADATNGKLLWHFNTGQTWKAGPMTYTVDGNQYIAVAAGSTILAFGLP